MKQCNSCLEILDNMCFPKDKRSRDGLNSICKSCENAKNKKYREENKEKFSMARKKYYANNIDKIRDEKKKYVAKTKDKKVAYDKQYRLENKEKIKTAKKNWEKSKKDDPIFKIKKNLRRRLHHALKGNLKADKTFSLIGCFPNELKLYLEKQFSGDMCWENYGSVWHVDHINPCDNFDFSNPDEQKVCFHFSNLRPLYKHDNVSKKYNIFNKRNN
jgi:hypothetical protein